MIPRYSPKDMAALFNDEARFGAMLEVELLAAEALSRLDIVPVADAAACRERAPEIDAAFVANVDAREAITNHDTAAFVDIVQDRIGAPEGAWIHYGLTSSDVVDTALCWQLSKAADLLIEASTELVAVLVRRARELIDVPVVGRTHGMHAEPTTFGAKMALFALAAVVAVLNRLLETSGGPQVQVIATTHAPFVLASLETIFDEARDRLFNLEMTPEGRVKLEDVKWARRGSVVEWLRSPAFDMKSGSSKEAELALIAANRWIKGEREGRDVAAIQAELERTLAGGDPFWPRWLVAKGDER